MNRWNGDTMMFANYLKEPILFLDTTKNESILEMNERFSPVVKNSFTFTSEELTALIEYIEARNY